MTLRPRRAHAERAAGVLERVLRRSGLHEGLRERRALTLWPEVVGRALARVTEPVSLREGSLLVRVRGASWRAELHHLLPELLARLNQLLDQPLREIRLVSGPLLRAADETSTAAGLRPRPSAPDADTSLETLIERARRAALRGPSRGHGD